MKSKHTLSVFGRGDLIEIDLNRIFNSSSWMRIFGRSAVTAWKLILKVILAEEVPEAIAPVPVPVPNRVKRRRLRHLLQRLRRSNNSIFFRLYFRASWISIITTITKVIILLAPNWWRIYDRISAYWDWWTTTITICTTIITINAYRRLKVPISPRYTVCRIRWSKINSRQLCLLQGICMRIIPVSLNIWLIYDSVSCDSLVLDLKLEIDSDIRYEKKKIVRAVENFFAITAFVNSV